MINSVESAQDIDEIIENVDYTLLCVDRLVMYEMTQAGELSNEELALLEELDGHFKKYLQPRQLNDLAAMEPEMPVKEWWG